MNNQTTNISLIGSDEAMEPVGLGAAKAVGDIAETKVGQALLFPSAKALGDYMGEGVQAWIERRKQQRSDNLRSHIEAVERITHEAPSESTKDADALLQWAAGASSVDPDDDALAAIWRAALLSLSENKSDRRRVLKIAQSLEADEAADFIIVAGMLRSSDLFGSRSSIPPHSRRKLQEIGLLEGTRETFARIIPIGLLYLGGVLVAAIYAITGSSLFRGFPMLELWVPLLLVVAVSLGAVAWASARSVRLTPLGRILKDLMSRLAASSPASVTPGTL